MKSIVEVVSTTNERSQLMEFLDQLRDKSYTLGFDVKSFMQNAPKSAHEVVVAIFEPAFSQGRDSFKKEIEKAQEDLKNLPVVGLTIAFEPTDRLAWNVKSWFKNELGRDVLIRFDIDKSLIGGAIVEGNGKRSEHSFRQYFDIKNKN